MKMPYFLGIFQRSKPVNRRKPVDTPLRGNVPRSALAVGEDYLIRAVFFRHVGEAAAPMDRHYRIVAVFSTKDQFH